jgi:hypothetical protein
MTFANLPRRKPNTRGPRTMWCPKGCGKSVQYIHSHWAKPVHYHCPRCSKQYRRKALLPLNPWLKRYERKDANKQPVTPGLIGRTKWKNLI